MFIAAGTRLNWVGNFSADAFSNQSAVDAVQAVAAGLKNKYNLIIERSNPSMSAGASQASTISLDLLTNMDRGNGSDGMVDIQGNVDDEFALVGNANDDSNITVTSGAMVSTTVNTSSCDTLVDKFRNALPTWLGGTPVTPNQAVCRTQAGNTAIQNVAVNAGAAYGAGSATAQAASTSAGAQQAANFSTQSQLAQDAIKAAQSSDNTMLYIGIGVAAVVVIVVGIVAVK
jgi:hypothetical protein